MIRITGLVAWYLLVGDVICGTMIRGGVARITVAYPRKFLAHRVLGWTLLAAVALHISAILYQHYKGWGFWQVAIPSLAGPLGRDLGVVATWLVVVILALAVLKRRIPKRQWHWIHRRVTFVLLALGTAHGLVAGSVSQGTQLPVILPAVVALTLLASVGVVRANVTATHRRTRQTVHPRHGRRVSLSRRYWPKIGALAALHVKEGNHVAKRTRQERQARSMRIMFGLVAALGVSVLILGADQFGTTGLRAFITRQGGVGATPDTKDCGHLSACGTTEVPGTSGRRVVAAPAHRQKSRRPTRRASAVPGTSPETTGRASTTTPTTERTTTVGTHPAATSTSAPAIRRTTTTTATTIGAPTTTTTTAPTTTTTTIIITTTTTALIPRLSPTASNRRSRTSEGSASGRTAGVGRRVDSSNTTSDERHHTSSN
jgi:hypothetical protein